MNKSILKKLPTLLAVLVMVGGVQTFTSCSSDDEGGGGNSGGGGGNGGGSGTCNANFRTVTIGTQTWMAENLNCNVEGSKCYDNDPANCTKYGRLYDWYMAMALPSNCDYSCLRQIQEKHKGICPSGWHIPTLDEWNVLKNYVESSSGCTYCDASKLKATSGWNNYMEGPSGDGNGSDEYGFSALPGGFRRNTYFQYVGESGYWWSANEIYGSNAYGWEMSNSFSSGGKYSDPPSFSFSVRCVKD